MKTAIPRGLPHRLCRLLPALGVLALGLVGGCGGWHLRGSGPDGRLEYVVYVAAPTANDVGRALTQQIVNRGGRMTINRTSADIIVDIAGERFERRTLSVDPDTGKVREIELELSTSFAVRTPSGTLLVPREDLNWQIDYVFDEGAVLGNIEQDHIIQRDLAETAATAIALRLQVLKLPDEETGGTAAGN
jgi:LPS-assembly lipoprotein